MEKGALAPLGRAPGEVYSELSPLHLWLGVDLVATSASPAPSQAWTALKPTLAPPSGTPPQCPLPEMPPHHLVGIGTAKGFSSAS